MNRFFVFVFVLILCSLARAGYDFGNGGLVIRCASANGRDFAPSDTLLDLVEGSNRGLTYHHLRSLRALSLDQAFDRMMRVHVGRAPEIERLFRAWFSHLASELDFVPGPVASLHNGGSLTIPRGCRRIQVAAQWIHVPMTLEMKQKIRIDRSAWAHMTSDQQAALLLHEYVIRWDYLFGTGCSYNVISRVSYLLSDQSLKDDEPQWYQFFSQPSTAGASCGYDAGRDFNFPH